MKKIYIVLMLVALLFSMAAKADERNILPRFPEIVIEKTYSQYFKVKDCQAMATISDDIAATNLKAILMNVSDKEISTSVKFRILYPTSLNKITININGKKFKYDAENPRYSFKLKPNEEIKFEMNANVYINYSIDAVRNSIKLMEEAEKENSGVKSAKSSVKAKGRELSDSFLRFFKSNERFGKRLQVGSLVSKWGLFPVSFEKLSVEIKVPENYTFISSFENSWQQSGKAKKLVSYKTTDAENYSDAIFLPSADKEEQLATMEILKSDLFRR